MNFSFGDLHCHPTYALMHQFSTSDDSLFNSANSHAWSVPDVKKISKLSKALRATNYTQASFAHHIKSNVRVAFAVLYAFEQGFFLNDKGNHSKAPSIVSLASSIPVERLRWILRNDDYNYWNEFLREYRFVLRKSGVASQGNISFKNDTDSNVQTAQVQGKYWLIADNPDAALQQAHITDAQYQGTKDNQFLPFEKFQEVANSQQPEMIVMLTVEGSHFLTLNQDFRQKSEGQRNAQREAEMWQRVQVLKSLDPPIFYITPSHHFNNTVISHSHSLPDMTTEHFLDDLHTMLHDESDSTDTANLVEQAKNEAEQAGENPEETLSMQDEQAADDGQARGLGLHINLKPNQLTNMNFITDGSAPASAGMNALGNRLLLELLHLAMENNVPVTQNKAGRRILIDVKHMSAQARSEFYNQIIRPFNAGKPLEERVPVLASHVAYAAIQDLATMAQNYNNETNESTSLNPDGTTTFTKWNINVSDEDIQVICESGGLLGLCLEQRVLGVPYNFLRDDIGIGRDNFAHTVKWQRMVADNVHAFVKAVKPENRKYDSDNSIWKCVCLGSDYDGGIDPLNDYPTSTNLPLLAQDLINAMQQWSDLADFGLTPDTVAQAVADICFNNLRDFVSRTYPKLKITSATPIA